MVLVHTKTDETAALQQLANAVLDIWPEHEKYLTGSFAGRSPALLESSERLAEKILILAGDDLPRYCADYRWTCEKLLEEELHFRRHGQYRLSTLKEACAEVYDDPEFMVPYLNGLLLSQVVWSNHSAVFDFYLRNYLPTLKPGAAHLEIGPGHGLFLYFAAAQKNITACHGWDISLTSVEETRAALVALSSPQDVTLSVVDALSPPEGVGRFDSIVLSEVLEHMEEPLRAMKILRGCLNPGGKVFINVPVNSPAPDHIYLLKTPEETAALLEEAGYDVLDQAFFPAGGYDLEKAKARQVTISCALIATPRLPA